MIRNVSDSLNAISQALDNNLDTFYNSEEKSNASWVLRLDAPYLMKWFLIYIRGGNAFYKICFTTTILYLKFVVTYFEYL